MQLMITSQNLSFLEHTDLKSKQLRIKKQKIQLPPFLKSLPKQQCKNEDVNERVGENEPADIYI